MSVVRVATCQFPVSADVGTNLGWIERQMRTSDERGAHVVHFPEGALSGYAGTDFSSFEGFDWTHLRSATEAVQRLAAELRTWVVLGSSHPLSAAHRPHNSVYVIGPDGAIVDRYDKRFCSGDAESETGDLAHYSPGDHATVWDIEGIRCGALICYDYRFPELHRELRRADAVLVFHSFHAANASREVVAAIVSAIGPEHEAHNPAATFSYPGITMPATMTAAAAANHMWISCANSSARESLWPAFAVRADGVTVGRLRRNVPGVLLTTVDTTLPIYDSTRAWRGRAMDGVLHSGTLVDDPRSTDRTSL